MLLNTHSKTHRFPATPNLIGLVLAINLLTPPAGRAQITLPPVSNPAPGHLDTALAGSLQGLGGNCLDVYGANASPGAKVDNFTCNGTEAQSFKFNTNGTITNFAGMCLDVLNGNAAAGVLQFTTCNGTASQQWQQKGALFLGLNGECLDVFAGNTAPGATVHLASCNGSASQNWSVINASTILQGVGTKCLDIINGSTSAGARLQIFECNRGPNSQIFTFTAAGEIRNQAGECLDITAGNITAGQVEMWPCNGGTNQKWQRGPNRQIISALTSVSSASGFCLGTVSSQNAQAAPSESGADHTTVGLARCNGLEAQQWIPSDLYVNGPATLLIVTSTAFAPTFGNFITHKQSIGIYTTLVTMSQIASGYPAPLFSVGPYHTPVYAGNDDALSLKSAIEDYYRNFGTKYVLLGGDNSQVPMRYREVLNGDNTTHSFHVSDLYYANLYSGHTVGSGFHGAFDNWDSNGNGYYDEQAWNNPLPNPDNVDGFPDIVVGRLPAYNTTSLSAILNKIIDYENQNPIYGGKGFPSVNQYGWVADACYGSYGLINQMTATVAGVPIVFVEEAGQTFEGSSCNAPGWPNLWPIDTRSWSLLESWLQSGSFEFLTYLGHGGQSVWGGNGTWSSSQISQLNSQYLPIVFAAACETAIIDGVGTAEIPDPGGVYPGSYRPPSYDTNASDYSSVSIGADFLFNPNGGAVAYSGENLVMPDDVGAAFMTFFFTEHNNGYARLGDSWRKAQQDYFNQNYVSSPLIANDSNDAPFAAPRIYLGTANLFGDPSMRMQ